MAIDTNQVNLKMLSNTDERGEYIFFIGSVLFLSNGFAHVTCLRYAMILLRAFLWPWSMHRHQ